MDAWNANTTKANHHVVMSPSQYAYLDLYQGDRQ